MSGQRKVVCVTGASGYIASWLVKLLLEKGYTVKATVRNIGDPKKVAHLKELEGANERLQLFQADITEDGSFDSIVDGCDGVFHGAAPTLFSVPDPQKDLIDPTVEGMLNVLRSCNRAGIKRVVITQSIVEASMNPNHQGPDVVVDETWSEDLESLKNTEKWYFLAKALAEEAARKYAEENGIKLLIINPAWVIGPLLQPALNFSSELILDLLKGEELFTNYQFAHVRDVANAHILAFENPSATGRYNIVESSMNHSELIQILNKLYPSLNLPNKGGDHPTYQICKKKAKSLGIDFIPVEVGLKETIESLKEKNFLKF